MDDDRKKSIDEAVQEIFDRGEDRKKLGRDDFVIDWQASLEIMILLMEKHLIKQPGQMLPMQIDGQDEGDFYYDIQEKLDLPPETCAVLITPSSFKNMPFHKLTESEIPDLEPWTGNAYSIIITGLNDQRVIMQASLPGIESVGIDVFEDGHHLANYNYNTIEECLNDLTKVTWTHFNPKYEWTDDLITRYTENWFTKGIDMDLGKTVLHDEFSYVHHPELLNLTPLESVFKVIETTIPKEYDNMDKAIGIFNDNNRDFNFGDPVITHDGILEDNESECRAFYGQIEFVIDQYLDKLEDIKGIKFPDRNIKNREFNRTYDETARKLYETITGRSCSISERLR